MQIVRLGGGERLHAGRRGYREILLQKAGGWEMDRLKVQIESQKEDEYL